MATMRDLLAALLIDLGEAGVELAPHPTDPTRLRYRPTTLTPELERFLGYLKADLLAILRGEGLPDDPDAGSVMAERLDAADELGLPIHPGSPEWLVAVGEAIRHDCSSTTTVVHCRHGETCGRDPPGCRIERKDPLSDRQGIGRISGSTVAAGER